MTPRRWMLFVDGENFTLRGQALMRSGEGSLEIGSHYEPDVFAWIPGVGATSCEIAQPISGPQLEPFAIRAYYYTSVVGDSAKIDDIRLALRRLGFQPEVFKRQRNQRQSKGVDVTLTKDLLVHAFNNNYDAAVLIAGDGDYVPVVEQLKRMGKSVYVAFFNERHGLSRALRLACDKCFGLTDTFVSGWTGRHPQSYEDILPAVRRTFVAGEVKSPED